MNSIPSVEESMAKIGASSWTIHGSSCRREREILAELADQHVNEHRAPGQVCGCGTPLVSTARDHFIKEILAQEFSKRKKQLENAGPAFEDWYGLNRETLALYVEFLKRSLNENIHSVHPAYLIYLDYMNTKLQEMERAQAELNRLVERLEGMKQIGPDGFIFSQDAIDELEWKAENQRQILSWL